VILLSILQNLMIKFVEVSRQQDVERYILSKHPKSAADVDYWLKQYNSSR